MSCHVILPKSPRIAAIVNVLLLYNTFRLLLPTLDSRTISPGNSNDREANLGPYSLGRKEYDVEKQSSPAMTAQTLSAYRSPVVQRSSNQNPTSVIHNSTLSHEHRTSTVSLLNLPERVYRPRAISPISELNTEITAIAYPPPVLSRSQNSRASSNGSIGLTSAPRHTRSPVVRYPSYDIKADNEGTNTSGGVWARQGPGRDAIGAVTYSPTEVPRTTAQSSDSSNRSRRTGHTALTLSAVVPRGYILPISPTIVSHNGHEPMLGPAKLVIRPLPPTP
jgi:hypothetical protein